MCLGLLVLAVDGIIPRRDRDLDARPGGVGGTAAAAARRRCPTLAALGVLVVLGVGVPIGTLFYWMAQSQHTTLPAAATLASATGATLTYSALGRARRRRAGAAGGA